MKHRTSELTGALLDLAVAMCEGERAKVDRARITMHHADGTLERVLVDEDRCHRKRLDPAAGEERGCFWLNYSGTWELGGPIIERERIALEPHMHRDHEWVANRNPDLYDPGWSDCECPWRGPTPLIAAMRAHVASKLGDEVELP